MPGNSEKQTVTKFAGFAAGVVIGAFFGPMIFRSLNPLAAAAGSLIVGMIGYFVVTLTFRIRTRRRDRALERAAESARRDAGLPDTISIHVTRGRALLGGTVDTAVERRRAEETIATLPGVREVVNQIHSRLAA
jgi:hypothetical protein